MDISVIWFVLFVVVLIYDVIAINKETKRKKRIRKMRHRRGLN